MIETTTVTKPKKRLTKAAHLRKMAQQRERRFLNRKKRLIAKYERGETITEMETQSVKFWLWFDNRPKWIPLQQRIF